MNIKRLIPKKNNEYERTAYHEIAHYIIAKHYNAEVKCIKINSIITSNCYGYVKYKLNKKHYKYNKSMASVYIAGQVIEEMIYNDDKYDKCGVDNLFSDYYIQEFNMSENVKLTKDDIKKDVYSILSENNNAINCIYSLLLENNKISDYKIKELLSQNNIKITRDY